MFPSVWREFRLVSVEDRGDLSKYNLVVSTTVFLCARGLRRIEFGEPPLFSKDLRNPQLSLRETRICCWIPEPIQVAKGITQALTHTPL